MSLFTGAATIAAALAAGGAATIAASKSSGAAKDAAQVNSDAATKAAQLKAQSDAEALAFSKQQAENDYRNQELTRRSNYDLAAANLARRGTLANLLGVQAPSMPAYVPSVDPNFTGGAPLPSTQTVPNASQSTPAGVPGNLSDPKAWMSLVGNKAALSQWVAQGLGSAASVPGLVDYYVGKVQGQPGANPTEQAGSANYWMQKLQSDPNVTGRAPAAASAASPAAASASTGTLGSMLAPYQTFNPTPALQIQPYQGTLTRLGAY